jgi:hypothetical protein
VPQHPAVIPSDGQIGQPDAGSPPPAEHRVRMLSCFHCSSPPWGGAVVYEAQLPIRPLSALFRCGRSRPLIFIDSIRHHDSAPAPAEASVIFTAVGCASHLTGR